MQLSQNLSDFAETGGVHSCNPYGVDWARLRKGLAEARFQAGLEVADLAKLTKLNKTTIYRLEDVDGKPNQKPDLPTIETWVLACELTLSEFFLQIERQTKGDSTAPPETGKDQPSPIGASSTQR